MLPREAGAHLAAPPLWRHLDRQYLAFRRHKRRDGFPLPAQHTITLCLLAVSGPYSRPVALRGKQGAAMQDRALASSRKSCRKRTMQTSLSTPDPLLLTGLFLRQALCPGSGHLVLVCSHYTWLRDRFENPGWVITCWFLSLRWLIFSKGSKHF